MKYFTALLFIVCALHLSAQTINKPYFEFTNTGIKNIDRISLTDTATIVDVKVTFLPNWWSVFSDKAYLEDVQTGKTYPVKDIKGAKFNEKIWTPKSGDTLVTLIFPKLDEKVKSVNYGDDGKNYIYGIYLQKNKKATNASVPLSVQNWLNERMAENKIKLASNSFFERDSIKIVGYLKGYDKRAGFSSGIIYNQNSLTREDLPTTVRIFEDGRFECDLLAIHPVSSNMLINDRRIPFYAEPGNTLGIILDWNDFLLADRYRDRQYEFEKIQYLGSNHLKLVNEGLAMVKWKFPDYKKLDDYRKKQKPEEFKRNQLLIWDNEKRIADSAFVTKKIPDYIKKLIVNDINLTYANYLFDYSTSRDYYRRQEPNNEILKLPISDDYFDFVSKIDLDDKSLLISEEFSTFINRFEFSPLFPESIAYNDDNGYSKLDSIYVKRNKKINFIYDIAKLRSLTSNFGFNLYKNKDFKNEITSFSSNLKEPFLVREMNRLYDEYKRGNVAYELPNTAAAVIFKKIINPLKGKILIVDFWAQWCGPCIAGIERSLDLRKKYKDNPDFDFVFVTDSESTETTFYADFITKNAMTISHRIKADEYLALRELFKFNGIPRYILVDSEGKIQDDNFQSHNLTHELNKYFPSKFGYDYWK